MVGGEQPNRTVSRVVRYCGCDELSTFVADEWCGGGFEQSARGDRR